MANAQGKIVQCIGAVVDVEFPRDQMPRIYDALKMEGSDLTLEVQQQLGDGVVRAIALGSSDGLRRGVQVYNTDAAITVPVGKATLGRLWRDAKLYEIGGGTTEIRRMLIGRELFR